MRIFRIATIFIALLFVGVVQSRAQVLSADRRIDWSKVGVVAPDGTPGIPKNPTCSLSVVTTADIQNAVSKCPDNTTVLIPAGTFSLAGLTINRPLVLRGAGADRTVLKISGSVLFSPVSGSYPSRTYAVNWTAGYQKGDTHLALASVDHLSVGQTIVLDQQNDPAFVHLEGNEGLQGTYSRNGLSFEGGSNRAQKQLVQVTAIDAATKSITIDPPLYFSHKAALAPEAFFWSGGNMSYAGIEDLKVDASALDGRAISFNFCSNCWVKGVEVSNTSRAGIAFVTYSFRPEIRDSYVHDSRGPFGPTRYGIELGDVSAGLFENNIVDRVVGSVVTTSSLSGSVFAYNYFLHTTFQNGTRTAWQFPSISTHMCHAYQNLYEGNVATNATLDVVWGSSSHNTLFRNRLPGYEDIPGLYINNTFPVRIQAWNRAISVIGNVLGDPSWHKYYEVSPWLPPDGKDERQFIYDLGEFGYVASTTGADRNVVDTLLRWGNYDYATKQAHWSASEIPAGIAVPSDHTLPNSFYRTSRPSWWGTGTWPPIGPSDPTSPASPLLATLPTQTCYQQIQSNGGKFNASVCYAGNLTPQPRAPTNLRAAN